METKTDVRHSRRRAGWPLVVAILGAFVLIGTNATSARADSNFERGFEDQMGRILAYEAVNLGKHVLVQGLFRPQYAYRDDHRYSGNDRHHSSGKYYTDNDRGRGPSHDHWKSYDDDDRHGHGNKHRLHARHHRHDRHCQHHASHRDRY